METNELSRDANGGTEMMMRLLHDSLPELTEKVQIIPTRVREVDPDRPTILWIHDLETDPEVQHLADPESVARFDLLVFVSYTQRNAFVKRFGIPYGKTVVIPNAIRPFDPDMIGYHEPGETVRMIYHTTPHRGLDILVTVFDALAKKYDIELDVYSSFEIYGWSERDLPYRGLFDFCKGHDRIRYHGYRPNEEVRGALYDTHLFAYPSTWEETSCIAVMEAMAAGCTVLVPDHGALPETVSIGRTFNCTVYAYHHDRTVHAKRFHAYLDGLLTIMNDVGIKRSNPNVVNACFDWENRKAYWTHILEAVTWEWQKK